ncbi:protein of unknown function [Burkholderia multivorans]
MQIILKLLHPEFDALRRHRAAKRRVHGGGPATCGIARDGLPAYARARAFMSNTHAIARATLMGKPVSFY